MMAKILKKHMSQGIGAALTGGSWWQTGGKTHQIATNYICLSDK
jgi:hypothetical protein